VAYWQYRPILPDLIGVSTFRMCKIRLGRMPSLLRELGVRSRDGSAHEDHYSVHRCVSRYSDQSSRSLIEDSFAFILPIFS